MSLTNTKSSVALAAFERGNAAFDRAEWVLAEEAYRESLAIQSDAALVRFNYGLLLLATRRPADAARELCAAVAADPGFALARVNLGSALHLLKRFADADEQFRAAAALGCDTPELNLN